MNIIFSLASGKHDKFKGVSYSPANSRSTEEFLNLLLTDDEVLLENIHSLISDCCQIYLNPNIKNTLINVKNAVCHSHARRRILEDLSRLKLDKIFLKFSNLPIKQFLLNLKSELNVKQIKLGPIGKKLLFAAFLLELLFRLEKDFPYKSKQIMEERRKKYSKPILNTYFKILENLVTGLKGVIRNIKDGKDEWKGTGVNIGEYSALYILNHREEFSEFINNGDIEITNNLSELFLREIARYRDCMEFFSTIDGIMGFTKLNSLSVTATLNHVNKFYYFLWVAVNLKIRVESYRLESIKNDPDKSSKQILLLPHKMNKMNEDGTKKTVGMFDPECESNYNMIMYDGLDVWTCAEMFRREKCNIKKEYY